MGVTRPPAVRLGTLAIRGLSERDAHRLVEALKREMQRLPPVAGAPIVPRHGAPLRLAPAGPEALGRHIAAALTGGTPPRAR